MRKILLLIPFVYFSIIANGQSLATPSSSKSVTTAEKIIKIYPNPAFNFIGLNNVSDISSIIIYNLVGRKIKKFAALKDERYDVTDLPRGMYLVQLLGNDGKVVTTQRMSKK